MQFANSALEAVKPLPTACAGMSAQAGAIAFSLDIELHQRVTLENGEQAQALTWAKSYLGVQSHDRAAAHIRHVLGGYVDQFIADYQRANGDAGPAPAQPGD